MRALQALERSAAPAHSTHRWSASAGRWPAMASDRDLSFPARTSARCRLGRLRSSRTPTFMTTTTPYVTLCGLRNHADLCPRSLFSVASHRALSVILMRPPRCTSRGIGWVSLEKLDHGDVESEATFGVWWKSRRSETARARVGSNASSNRSPMTSAWLPQPIDSRNHAGVSRNQKMAHPTSTRPRPS